MPLLCQKINVSDHRIIRVVLGITWPEIMSTAEFTQQAKLTPLSHAIRKRRLRLAGLVIRMQSRCETPLATLLTTVPMNSNLQHGHG